MFSRGTPFIATVCFGQEVNSYSVTVLEDLLKIIITLKQEWL